MVIAPMSIPSLAPMTMASMPSLGPLLMLRGGTALDRTKLRLESHQSYAVIAALLMNAALRLWGERMTFDHVRSMPRWLTRTMRYGFMAATVVSVMGGMYATVVFALVGVYAKSALGLGMDDECDAFLRSTHIYRQQAYQAFVIALHGLMVSFLLSTLIKLNEEDDHDVLHWAFLGGGLLLAAFVGHQWLTVMKFANDLVYRPRFAAGL